MVFYRHGLAYSVEYGAWRNIKQRCYNPSNKYFKDYGARGIEVCGRWRDSFLNFLADMGNKPTPKHSLDRIDNDKGYSPENCRWATASEQGLNRRKQSNNTSGHTGVVWVKRHNRWKAVIMTNGKTKFLGNFVNIEDAIEARDKARQSLQEENNA